MASTGSNSPSFERLILLGEQAAADLASQGKVSFLAAVNDPTGAFAGDTEYISVIAGNGALLADPAAPFWIGEEIASYMDQNTVPYGHARRALALHGGGMLYENDFANTSSGGELLISHVRPEDDGVIITASRRTHTGIPTIAEASITSLISLPESDEEPDSSSYQQVTIPIGTGDVTVAGDDTFGPDRNGISLLPVIYALASEGGGLCYGIEPEGDDITLFYVSPDTDGQIAVRWVPESGREQKEEDVIHS